jgi:hypothetical protein
MCFGLRGWLAGNKNCGFNDWERANEALKGIAGKRLTYRRIGLLAA